MTIKLPLGDAIPLYYAQTHRTYYDPTRQDLAPEFEDPRDLFHGGSGYLHAAYGVGPAHGSRRMYVVVASHPPVPFARRLDLSLF